MFTNLLCQKPVRQKKCTKSVPRDKDSQMAPVNCLKIQCFCRNNWCLGRESNPHGDKAPRDFKSDTVILVRPNCFAIPTTYIYPTLSFSTGCSPGAFLPLAHDFLYHLLLKSTRSTLYPENFCFILNPNYALMV